MIVRGIAALVIGALSVITTERGAVAETPPATVPPLLPAGALPVPLVRQATTYSCGAAALLAVLYYWRAFDGPESALYRALHTTPADGTDPRAIARVARTHGLDASFRDGMSDAELRDRIAAGATVILDLQAWADAPRTLDAWARDWDDGHYAVVVAVDEARVYLMDPSTPAGYGYVDWPELRARWHDELVRGPRRRRQRMAIVVTGRRHLSSVPAPLAPVR